MELLVAMAVASVLSLSVLTFLGRFQKMYSVLQVQYSQDSAELLHQMKCSGPFSTFKEECFK